MTLYSCPRCSAFFSTDADDIQIHLVQKHDWPTYDAMVWFEQELQKGEQR